MTKITYIPGEIANAAIDEHGNRKPVTRTQHIFDDAKGKSQAEVNADIDDTLAFHQSEINALNSQNYVTVDSFNALPATGASDTVYRVSNWDGSQQDPSVYSEYAWNGSQYVHLSTKTQIGEVFDISAYHATGGILATYADLSAALDSNNGGGVPQSLQKGGMSVKYVHSIDNKYVQFRLMKNQWSTTPSDWQGVDDEPVAGSDNLVKSGGIYSENIETRLPFFDKKEPNVQSSFIINTNGTIQSVSSPIFTIRYFSVSKKSLVKIKFTRTTDYFADGTVCIVDSPSDIVNGKSVNILYQFTYNTTEEHEFAVPAGKTLIIGTHVNDVIAAKAYSEYNNELSIPQRIDEVDNVADYSDNFIKKAFLLTEKNVPEVVGLVIDDNPQFVEVPSSGFRVKYIQNTGSMYQNCQVTYNRVNSYVYDGRIGLVNSPSDIVNGNSVQLIHTVAVGTENLNFVIPAGKTIVIAYATLDVVTFKTEDTTRINNILEGKTAIPTDYQGKDVCTFKKMLCIGDSLTFGSFNYTPIPGETFLNPTGYSYPDNFTRMTGVETVNLGVGSITSAGWYEAFQNSDMIEGCDCCIIQLGVNDDNTTLDTVSRQAFINIINLVKTKNKQIKIFLSGIINAKSYRAASSSDTYYAKDQFIRNLYNELYANDDQVFFIDHVAYGHLCDLQSSNNLDNYNMGHLSAYGYWRLAMDYVAYISYIMATDTSNCFRFIQFTGTDFTYS